MLKKVSFNFKGKRINVESIECKGLNRFFGLMFKDKKEANALLFEFKKTVDFRIHSFFVFFPFVVVWLDDRNKVLEVKRVRPFTLSIKAKKSYKKFLEIPLNRRYREKIKFLLSRR